MKKVINVNLGGRAFIINEDAFDALDKYLKSIERHFSRSGGFEDILYDIENRIAELFQADEKNGTIITIEKIEKVKAIMGDPKDFGDEEFEEEKTESKIFTHKTGKRLFRDPDDKVIAGVASGLSAYLGFRDPIFLRILFVIFAFSGIGIIPYLVFWIAVPEAKTSSDRLAMRGEDININSIANTVEESLNELKNKIEDIGKGLKTKIL
jgi:phage shock protein PspC (stress-responsive transcriptional regulator)